MGERREEKQQKKRGRGRKWLVMFGTFAALFLGVLLFAYSTRLTDVTVTGTGRYTEEELISMIFKEDRDWNTFYALYKNKFKEHEDIPFIEKYQVKVTGLHSAKVTVYEKSLAGCIEYMGSYLYFDREGIIVESSRELTPMVPLVTGLRFQNVVMYEKLTVEDDSIFSEILNLSQLLAGYEIQTEEVHFDSHKNIFLKVGSLTVVLGDSTYMAEKLSEFHDMLPQIEALSGTVYLDGYSPDAQNPSYPFIQN